MLITASTLLSRYDRIRIRAREMFDSVADAAYYSRPIPLRNPIVFYQGHMSAFSFEMLVRRPFHRPRIDTRLECLFARGIDPHESIAQPSARHNEADSWPPRDEVKSFCMEADRRVRAMLAEIDMNPSIDREPAHRILEHEAMHLETLIYLWHRLPLHQKRRPADYRPMVDGGAPEQALVDIPPGLAALGIDHNTTAFAWDNEMPAFTVAVPSFRIEQHNVTNAQYLDFVDAGGYRDPKWWLPRDWAWIQATGIQHPQFWQRERGHWQWRAMFEHLALPSSWPVWVTQAEASAYARWRRLALPSEAQYQRAAFGSPDNRARRHPWGDAAPEPPHGAFDFQSWDPQPAGSHPAGRSAWGVHDLVGNGWEWTATPFAPFPGFHPMASYPEYSADFFDDEHFVLKGASPATARELLRPSMRNWFRARYPYVFASFRCVDAAAQ